MALGRQGERQTDLMIGWAELPRSPGHAFYDRLQAVLVGAGFDRSAEEECAPYYASRRGRPSIPPGRYLRTHLVGYFEGIDSERGIERRADGEGYREMLERLAEESGIATPTAEDLIRLDRKRKGKRLSNAEWASPTDPEARIAKLKDGRTHLAYKPEHAVDLDTGAI